MDYSKDPVVAEHTLKILKEEYGIDPLADIEGELRHHRAILRIKSNYNILEHFRLVRQYFLYVERISLFHLEALLFFYPKKIFTRYDLASQIAGEKNQQQAFNVLKKKGWVRRSKLAHYNQHKGHLYCLTNQGKDIVERFYGYLSREIPLPEIPLQKFKENMKKKSAQRLCFKLNQLSDPDRLPEHPHYPTSVVLPESLDGA